MPIKCPRGTSTQYRFIKDTNIRLGGCMKNNRFIKDGIVEVKKVIKKVGNNEV